jgi:hypothetical protein
MLLKFLGKYAQFGAELALYEIFKADVLKVVGQMVGFTPGEHITRFVVKLECPRAGRLAQVDCAFIAGTATVARTRTHFGGMQPSFNAGIVANIIKLVNVDHFYFVIETFAL